MADPGFRFEHTFRDRLPALWEPVRPDVAPAPVLLTLDVDLADDLGLDPEALRSPEGVRMLCGTDLAPGSEPVAQAYSGHQFGGFSPRLGDGRAALLGEHVAPDGTRVDVHLKGSGRTVFARGGDGKAVVGPMLREAVVSAAMHALDVPTTRSLAVVATGETVVRDAFVPGAILTRTEASHLRVGTFQYAAALGEPDTLRALTAYAIERHHPAAAGAPVPALALLEAATGAQARLVAAWMLIGFVHGVMNTDNMTISGETIDYGPCAFLDVWDPAAVFSSIDSGGRYAFGNQPGIALWNLARLAETLLPMIDTDSERAVTRATEVLHGFEPAFETAWRSGMTAKLGLDPGAPDVTALTDGVTDLLRDQQVDGTSFFRALADAARGDDAPLLALVADPRAADDWIARWRRALAPGDPVAVAAAMDRVNPRVIPRNHLVEEALAAATAGDLAPLDALLDAVRRPFDLDVDERFTQPAPSGFGPYRTFCGT
jgi:uncharacterized protein YdiU (UPF0061 family)